MPSMSGIGICFDNVQAKTWFAWLKVECVDIVYNTKAVARAILYEYVEVFYNRQRLYSQLGYTSDYCQRCF